VGRGSITRESWRPIERGLHRWSGLPASPLLVLQATLLRLPDNAVFSGRTAAWLYGLDLPPCSPIDVTVPAGSHVSGRAGLSFHKTKLAAHEIGFERGLPLTSELRTVLDLARRLPSTEAIIALDMALHQGLVEMVELHDYLAAHRGEWGVARVRRAVDLAEPATESPQETRLRLILSRGGLPRPLAQVSIHDADGDFVARPDFLYPEARLAIEYDGGTHRDSLVEDNRRQNRLQNAGYRLLRFTAPDLQKPAAVVAEVKEALMAQKVLVSRETH
jgi:hypothetical protein